MCCGGDEAKSESTSKTQVPEWLLSGYKRLFGRAEDLSEQPYQAYAGTRVAPLNADQQQGFAKVRADQGIAKPYIDAAYQAAQQGAAPVTWGQVEDAYNPTIQAQVRRMQDDFNYQNNIGDQRVQSDAAKMGLLSGGGGGARKALNYSRAQQERQQNPILAGIRSQAYDRAWQGAEGNRDAAARGSQIYGMLGKQAQDAAGEDAQRLLTIGGAQQKQNQSGLDWLYQQFREKMQNPYQNIQWATGIAGVGPGFSQETTGTQTQTQPNSLFGDILGAGATVLGGWLGSDERLKENIVEIGKSYDGQTIYRYNYKGDPTTRIGFIAQEVEQSHPEAVGEVGGLKTVNYDLATRDAAEAPHKRQEGGFAYGGPVQTRMEGQPSPAGLSLGDDNPGLARIAKGVSATVQALKGKKDGGRVGYSGGGLIGSLGGEGGMGALSMAGGPMSGMALMSSLMGHDQEKAPETELGEDEEQKRRLFDLGNAIPYGDSMGALSLGSGFAEGGLVVPLAEMQDFGDSSIIPETQLSPPSPLQTPQAPQMSAPGQSETSAAFDKLDSVGGKFGKWLGKPGGDGWGATVRSVEPGSLGFGGFKFGGVADEEEDGRPALFDVPNLREGSTFNAPIARVAGLDPERTSVPGVTRDRPASSRGGQDSLVPTIDLGDLQAAPIQSLGSDYAPPPIAQETSSPEAGAPAPSAKSLAWYEPDEGKQWYEAGSNPDLGTALALAGAAMMGRRGTLARKLGAGVGTGVGTYLSQANAQREQDRLDRQAEIKATEMQRDLEMRRADQRYKDDVLQESKRHNLVTEGKGSTVPDIAKYEYAKKHGYEGSPNDFWKEERTRASESTLTREEAKKAVSRLEQLKSQGDSARTGLANLAQMRANRDKVSYEGSMFFPGTRTAIGKTFPILGALPFIPDAEEAGAAEAVGSLATQMQLDFTNATKGAISDAEMRLFGTATPGMQMSDDGANKIFEGMEAGYERAKERSKFYEAYLKANRSLAGADEVWDTYVTQNPIMSKDVKTGDLVVNRANVGNWKNYVGSDADEVPVGGAPQSAPSQQAVRVQSLDEAKALEPGTRFIGPDGTERVKK